MDVRVVNLKRQFERTQAVKDISFSFSGGDIFGFVGPNGAGKTTTMRILATLDEPTEGDAFIDGISVVDEPEKARHLVGYMPDTLPVHRDMTVHEYLDFFARAYKLSGHKRRAAVESVEEFTNLLGIRDKLLRALSKGMKQRVSLARAIIHDPPVLILDEPAAGLDPRGRVELRELLLALSARGKAILISSHILTELSEICNGAVVIEQGRLLRAGSLAEIVAGETEQRHLVIRTAGGPERLYKELIQSPWAIEARIVGPHVEVQVDLDESANNAILTEIIGKGFSILHFRQKEMDLEDVFMSVTKGGVQ